MRGNGKDSRTHGAVALAKIENCAGVRGVCRLPPDFPVPRRSCLQSFRKKIFRKSGKNDILMSIKKRGAVGLAFRSFCGHRAVGIGARVFFFANATFSVTARNWRFRHFCAVTENGRESAALGRG